MNDEMLPQPSEKELLEIQKLRADIHAANFNKWAQFSTPLTVLACGMAVLFLFQQPQIAQMEAARLSNEKIQISNVLNTVMQLSDVPSKKQLLESLVRDYPQHQGIRSIRDSYEIISQPLPKPDSTSENRCDQFISRNSELQSNLTALEERLQAEIKGAFGGTRRPGVGPFARAIMDQTRAVESEIAALKAAANAARCL
jgi:hypothetical protein